MGIIEQILLTDLGDEGEYPSDEILSLIEQAFIDLATEDLAEALFSCSDTSELQKVAKILNIAAWCSNDNGASAQVTLESWLRGENTSKIWVSLHTECYPFKETEEMIEVLTNVKTKFPEHSKRCEELITGRLA